MLLPSLSDALSIQGVRPIVHVDNWVNILSSTTSSCRSPSQPQTQSFWWVNSLCWHPFCLDGWAQADHSKDLALHNRRIKHQSNMCWRTWASCEGRVGSVQPLCWWITPAGSQDLHPDIYSTGQFQSAATSSHHTLREGSWGAELHWWSSTSPEWVKIYWWRCEL